MWGPGGCAGVGERLTLRPPPFPWYPFTTTNRPTMGRASKLKLERKQKISAALAPSLYDDFDVSKFKRLGDESPVAQYLSMSCKQAEYFRLKVAKLSLDLFFRAIPKLKPEITSLPCKFYDSFVRLLGHSLVPGRLKEGWSDVCEDLHAISDGDHNEASLAKWPFAPSLLEDFVDARVACYGILEAICNDPLSFVNPTYFKSLVLCANGMEIEHDAIRNHLVICGAKSAGYALCKAGSLLLIDQSCGRPLGGNIGFDPLWLVRLRPDGIYAYGRLAEVGGLLPSEIKAMRNFVVNYNGAPLRGEFIGGRRHKSAKLCKAVGLRVEGIHCWLDSNRYPIRTPPPPFGCVAAASGQAGTPGSLIPAPCP